MTLFTDEEKATLSIRRMIFHVVGKALDEPVLLDEITPPQFADFFLERVKSALSGNLFEFRENSSVERILRLIVAHADTFGDQSKSLARDFHSRHSGITSVGVFFVFELGMVRDQTAYALIKYDNEDVVRYLVNPGSQVPSLERFQESFVRKAEAMQKIALVRLDVEGGGRVAVRDRSNMAHISDYFEGFLQVRRVNSPDELSDKLITVFKDTFRSHRSELSDEIKRSGVNRIYDVLRQPGRAFGPENSEPLFSAIFGQFPPEAPIRRTFSQRLKHHGVAEETFNINPDLVQRPSRRRIETMEGTQIIFEEEHRPTITRRDDGRTQITVVTASVVRDDVDTEKAPRGR